MWCTHGLPLQSLPWMIAFVSALQIAFFFLVPLDDIALHLYHRRLHEWGDVVGALFAHASAVHLISNVVSGLMVGTWVELAHGHLRLLVVYFGAGVGGVLNFRSSWCIYNAEQRVIYVGASPAVYGLMGASIAHLVINWSEVRMRGFSLLLCLGVLVFEVAAYLFYPLPNVAYSSHVGGALCGAGLGPLVLRNVRIHPHERLLAVFCSVGLVLFAISTLVSCAD